MRLIKKKLAIIALTMSTLCGAFFVPSTVVFASEGNGSVGVDLPKGWQNKPVTLQVKVEDYVIHDRKGKELPVTAKCVRASFDEGKYEDITDSMVVTVSHNGKLRLQVIYTDGGSASESYTIENFDLELPTIQASVIGENMYLEAKDELSGVAGININQKTYTELKDGQLCVNIKDLESTEEFITVYSIDQAGNNSKQFKVKNPYYVGPIDSGSTDQGIENPDSIEPTDPTHARGTVYDNCVTTEDGEVTKEFYTVEASGKTFYLIVDKTQTQDNVYLLTEAGVNDLLNFVDYNGVDVQNGEVPMYEIPSTGMKETEVVSTDETEEEPEAESGKPKNNSMSTFIIVVLVCAVGLGYYLIRNKKRKDTLAEAEEMDAFDVPDEDEDYGMDENEEENTEEEYEEGEHQEEETSYSEDYEENVYDDVRFPDEEQVYDTKQQ